MSFYKNMWNLTINDFYQKIKNIYSEFTTLNGKVEIQGVQSTDNSIITPLSSGATFTGTWEQNNYSDVGVSCQTDNSGILYFDFSPDSEKILFQSGDIDEPILYIADVNSAARPQKLITGAFSPCWH